ncbi:hypothetical protein [Hymenobacter lapidiphilus]|uniref:hypothetical protein n=1 Tax=Hymenobacter sp. CCM 8763 TaxID=2303334 RepID=UPI0011C1736A|nr:hypothetical protein [Hymenobacter sp. CCM 8763]
MAQDIIVCINDTRIEARVLAVKATAISYQHWTGPDSSITIISTDYVRYIRYHNGTQQNFASVVPKRLSVLKERKPVNLGRNVVGIRPVDLLSINATLTYEHLFGSRRRVGLKVPLTLKLVHARAENYYSWVVYQSSSWGYYQSNKFFGTGLELNFYTGPPARFRYFFGPALQYGRFRYRSGEQYMGEADFFGLNLGKVYRYEDAVGEHVALLLNNGVRYQVGKRCVFTGEGGIGWQTKVLDKDHKNLDTEELAGSDFKIAVNLGFGYQF